MEQELIQFGECHKTMSSLEIAEVIGKPHNDIMKAIRKMEPAWEKVAQGKFSRGTYQDKNNQARPCYNLTYRETLFVATKFNDEAMAKQINVRMYFRLGIFAQRYLLKRLKAVMVNATQMAKPLGDSKRAKNWLGLKSTQEFLSVLNEGKNLPSSDLVKVTHGNNGSTWMHEDVAIEFSRWLSPKFAIWYNDRSAD